MLNLKPQIKEKLWEMIEKNYENESYSSAILDSIHLLTETIRNKTGLEGDGGSLVGQAFGGENPKIQLSKLQTDSEKNIQKGIQEILRGVYTAIRNPRSHDKLNDSKEEADSIILFINYLLGIINISKSNFDESAFLERVFDEHFIESEKYADLLISEIPKRKRIDIGIQVILNRHKADISKAKCFMDSLFKNFKENEIVQIYKVISDELKYATPQNNDIQIILAICPAKYWNYVDKAVKWRVENILYENVEFGKYSLDNDRCFYGALGTWIEADHLSCFEEIQEWNDLIIFKLKSEDKDEASYINNYFWRKICEINYDNINFNLKEYIKDGLLNKDDEMLRKIASIIFGDRTHPWWKVFHDELGKCPEIQLLDVSEIPF